MDKAVVSLFLITTHHLGLVSAIITLIQITSTYRIVLLCSVPLWECDPLFFFFFFSNTECNKVRKVGLHEGKENNQYAVPFFFIFVPFFFYFAWSLQGQIWRMKEGPYNGREGWGAGRIREEAAAICLWVRITMCEEPVGRYESHKLSC